MKTGDIVYSMRDNRIIELIIYSIITEERISGYVNAKYSLIINSDYIIYKEKQSKGEESRFNHFPQIFLLEERDMHLTKEALIKSLL